MGILTLVSRHFKDLRPLKGMQYRAGTQGRADTDMRQDVDAAFVAVERTIDSADQVGVSPRPAPTDLGAMAANATLTIAQLLTGVVHGDPGGVARTLTMPTPALVVAGIADAAVGDSFEFHIVNQADADTETLTMTAVAGGTLVGKAVVNSPVAGGAEEPSGSAKFLMRLTNVTAASEAYTFYRCG